MELLWVLLGCVALFAVALALTLRVAVRWGQEGLELRDYGTEVSGRVLEKRRVQRRGAVSSWIRYEYTDHVGKTHRSRRTLVTPDAWDTLQEGAPIAVVFSQRKPAISLPKYLMDLSPKQ